MHASPLLYTAAHPQPLPTTAAAWTVLETPNPIPSNYVIVITSVQMAGRDVILQGMKRQEDDSKVRELLGWGGSREQGSALDTVGCSESPRIWSRKAWLSNRLPE